ncbi:MAG: hydrogenase/urease maturation nickel metallochaperone HypA [Candidatus Micrarchaeia archaeon]
MEELNIVKEILAKLLEEASEQGVRTIRTAEIAIGEAFPMQVKDLKYWLTELARGTPAENAKFKFKKGRIKGSAYVITEISEY